MYKREAAERILEMINKFGNDKEWILNYISRELEIAELIGYTKADTERLK